MEKGEREVTHDAGGLRAVSWLAEHPRGVYKRRKRLAESRRSDKRRRRKLKFENDIAIDPVK